MPPNLAERSRFNSNCDYKDIIMSYINVMLIWLVSCKCLLLSPSLMNSVIMCHLLIILIVLDRSSAPPQTATTALPMFSPCRIPIKAAGMFSKPLVMCSRHCSLPCRCRINKSQRLHSSRNMGIPNNLD